VGVSGGYYVRSLPLGARSISFAALCGQFARPPPCPCGDPSFRVLAGSLVTIPLMRHSLVCPACALGLGWFAQFRIPRAIASRPPEADRLSPTREMLACFFGFLTQEPVWLGCEFQDWDLLHQPPRAARFRARNLAQRRLWASAIFFRAAADIVLRPPLEDSRPGRASPKALMARSRCSTVICACSLCTLSWRRINPPLLLMISA